MGIFILKDDHKTIFNTHLKAKTLRMILKSKSASSAHEYILK